MLGVLCKPPASPDVFIVPAEFTPGKVIFAEPLKDTPPMSLAVANTVADAASPVHEPELPETVVWSTVALAAIPLNLVLNADVKLISVNPPFPTL